MELLGVEHAAVAASRDDKLLRGRDKVAVCDDARHLGWRDFDHARYPGILGMADIVEIPPHKL